VNEWPQGHDKLFEPLGKGWAEDYFVIDPVFTK
jgi:hypothetical protein